MECILCKVPYAEEQRLSAEIWESITDAFSRMFFPFLIFEKDKAIENLKTAKSKLEELV